MFLSCCIDSVIGLFVLQGAVIQVPLIRMASADMRERQRVFEIFEELKVNIISDNSGFRRAF
jgi:hypothetical protein